ncbi:MAG: type II secretion system F family protein [Candidatus Micrarchaeota archaeon]|nr:type II secretion system F family protein [Candidatus Micrarchaeota archaeon]
MIDFSKFYAILGARFPIGMRDYIEGKLTYGGVDESSVSWLGSRSLLIFLFSIVGTLLYSLFQPEAPLYLFILFFFIIAFILVFLSYTAIYYSISTRAVKVEKVLPDFLMLIVSNLHAGMTPFSAFVRAARPEFGPLYSEVMGASALVGGKRTLDDAMVHLGSRFDSEVFRKSIDLFLKGTKSGGQLGKLLSANAEQIRKIQDLRAELITSTKTYAIFLAFIVAIVMPFLLGISYNFLSTFLNIQAQVGISKGSALPVAVSFFSGDLGITTSEMLFISLVTFTITAFLTSMFMGIVISGKPLLGLKYFPLLLVFGGSFFFLTQKILQSVLPH